jgi:O-acetyl-ADP-ribose deacetylase (regulator of RNase III)
MDPSYPAANAAKSALATVRQWLTSDDQRAQVDRIIFVCPTQRDLALYREQIKTYFPPF